MEIHYIRGNKFTAETYSGKGFLLVDLLGLYVVISTGGKVKILLALRQVSREHERS
jgi:hypothetical protein